MNKVTFYIANMAYSFKVNKALETDLKEFLSGNELETKELLMAYIRRSQQYLRLKNELEEISQKLPKIDEK